MIRIAPSILSANFVRLEEDIKAAEDAGAHMLPVLHLWQSGEANQSLISRGLSTMGFALPAAIGIFSIHALVMIILLTGYRDVVATDSLVAMTIRIVVWLIILVLMFLQRRKVKVNQTASVLTQAPG